MDMLKHIYKGVFGILLTGFAACTTGQLEEDDFTPGTTPILFAGTVTRAGEEANGNLDDYSGLYSNPNTGLYLSAKTESGSSFFSNTEITEIVHNSDIKSNLKTTVYYPLDKEKKIYLYAHTGKATSTGNLNLASGTGLINDALISNGTNGKGTEGSAKDPVKLLTFRHVMTKLEVAIEVDKTDDSAVENAQPEDISFRFKNSVLPSTGTYSLTTNEAIATGNTAYPLSVGTHYVVPTGANLTKGTNIIEYLKIDDYTASVNDFSQLKIPEASNNGTSSDLILSPGLAYKLTFIIKRLKVVDIKVTITDWKVTNGNGIWGYEPHTVQMNVSGGYEKNNDKINKIVLHHTISSDTYQYIGSCEDGNAKFLTLPTDFGSGELTADLYTGNGLLIEGHPITCSSSSGIPEFDIQLGANGMVKDADGFYKVGTPLQFHNLMSNPGEDTDDDSEKHYKLVNDIDINSLPSSLGIPLSDFPEGGIFDGTGHTILHLALKGKGLFETNRGTLKGIHIAFSSIDATGGDANSYVGSICSVNNGSIEGCINEADIRTEKDQVAGGICGKNAGTILACLNSGNIPDGKEIGGICGENASSTDNAIMACINAGMLHGSSNHGIDTNIGGICGLQSVAGSTAVINSCYWLTGSARPVQGNSEEKAIGNSTTEGNYCTNSTNMMEALLRTEAVDKLNIALAASDWEFEWKQNTSGNSTGTYKTVWPIPIK